MLQMETPLSLKKKKKREKKTWSKTRLDFKETQACNKIHFFSLLTVLSQANHNYCEPVSSSLKYT